MQRNAQSGGALFYLCGFGILPGFRGQGLAKAALSRILADCPAGGRLFLQVSTENAPAFSLYQSMGFLTGTMEIAGLPPVVPGHMVTLAKINDDFNRDYFITKVVHHMDTEGFETTIHFAGNKV